MKLETISHKTSHSNPIPAFDFLFAAADKRPAATAAKRERSWLQRPLRTRRV